VPGARDMNTWQIPKLASSVAHLAGGRGLCWCEIFGGYGQALTYPDMKWLTDHQQLRGVNFLITHSFNPHAPYDHDYPPYFYNGGHEPRFPLYRVWADYNSRLSLLLTGGGHVAQFAFLQAGQSRHVGRAVRPEALTSVLQDALYDCDWITEEHLRSAVVSNRCLRIAGESYPVLVLPGCEAVTWPVLEKAAAFLDDGGIVAAQEFVPSRSATPGRSSADVARLAGRIFRSGNPRAFVIPAGLSPDGFRRLFAAAGIVPGLDVVAGRTDGNLHVLRRRKDGRDVFFVCNQNLAGGERAFVLRAADIPGEPVCWDPMRNEITSLPPSGASGFRLSLAPRESVVLVFSPHGEARERPPRLDHPEGPVIPVVRDPAFKAAAAPDDAPVRAAKGTVSPVRADPYRGTFVWGGSSARERVYLEADDVAPECAATVRINGADAGGFIGPPARLEVGGLLRNGTNTVEVLPFAPRAVRIRRVAEPAAREAEDG